MNREFRIGWFNRCAERSVWLAFACRSFGSLSSTVGSFGPNSTKIPPCGYRDGASGLQRYQATSNALDTFDIVVARQDTSIYGLGRFISECLGEKIRGRKFGKKKQVLTFRTLLGLLMSSLIASCSENVVPSNALLDITPRSHSVQVTEIRDNFERCIFEAGNFMDIPLVLQLTTADGSPIGNSLMRVYADFSENTYPGYAVLALYDDVNSNGVIDSDTELVSGFEDDIAVVSSGRFTGAKTLMLRVNLSCSFRGEIRAIASGVSGSTVIEVLGASTQSIFTDDSGWAL